ncbi:TIGR03086 family metal-binding protein [Nocardia sp. NPDC058705]|uniref:TIGR03086 family metal-binding protein n=1 Tax=Nocardia sp. NPDC058705 TaxID=3346609 RepID=UPI00368D61FE
MSENERVARAAEPLSKILRTITSDRLADPTPCADFDVRALLNHLLHWGPSLIGAARKGEIAPGPEVDLTTGDWAAALDTQLTDLAAAWGRPDAWQGVTRMGGPMELPAPLVGGMVVGELIVHGWDLARAVGTTVHWDDDLLRETYNDTAATAEQGRELGIYGPEIPIDTGAPLLDRILGLTGRNPAWTCSSAL